MVRPPTDDGDVRRVAADLGLPGLVDMHVHFLPPPVLRKVWDWFDAARLADGSPWPIAYREPDSVRVARLSAMGVRRFTALAYAHKPGMAGWLNRWSADFAARTPGCIPSATFFPEPGVLADVDEALESGAQVFKVHLQVGGFDPREPRLREVWARLAAAQVPVVVHTGSSPQPGPFTGPDVFADVLAASPTLRAVIAHMGAHEHEAYLDLALDHPHVHLDTTMAFTDFFRRVVTYDDAYLARLTDVGERIVLGSDFPNIPYAYAHQIAALVRLGYGDEWLRAVLHDNAVRLLEAASR